MHSARFALGIAVVLSVSAAAAQQRDTRPVGDLRGHSAPVRTVVYDPNGKYIYSAAMRGGIFVWDPATRTRVKEIAPTGRVVDGNASAANYSDRRIECIAVSPDGTLLSEASVEGNQAATLRLWKSSGELVKTLVPAGRSIRCTTFTSDGKAVVASVLESGNGVPRVLFFDVESGKVTRELSSDKVFANLLAVSPDGQWLATVSASKLHIWELAGGTIVHEITSHRKPITDLKFSPDSKWFATAAGDEPIRLWNAADAKMIREWQANQDGCNGLAFSPTAKTLASAGNDKTVKLWNPESGKMFERLWGHGQRVLTVCYNPDGTSLASGAADETIELWKTREADFKERKETKTESEMDKLKKKEEEQKKERKRLGLPEKP